MRRRTRHSSARPRTRSCFTMRGAPGSAIGGRQRSGGSGRAAAPSPGGGWGPPLFGGFPGIAWVIQHVSGAPPEEGDALEDVDQLLCEHVARAPFPGTSEELFGIGMYALERMPSPAARRMLEHIVARLAEMADRFADGVAWTTRSE